MLNQGQMGATTLLARMLAAIPDPTDEGTFMDDIVGSDSGVSAEVTLPTGDRYVVVVQWIGDRESATA